VSRSQLRLYRNADRQHGELLKTLHDAQVLQWDGRGIFIQGWEIELNSDGQQVQQVQIWCVTPLA